MSELWAALGEQHRSVLAEKGAVHFKRDVINFQYGQWAVRSFHHPFTRQLLASLLRAGRIPKLARVDWTDTDHICWPDEPSSSWWLRAYAFYCGLLWQYASGRDTLGCLSVEEPTLGHPMPIYLNGRLISQDLAMASLDLNSINEHLPLRSVRRVLEIGAGYGRTAYLFCSLFPETEYTIVDIEPARTLAQRYLSAVLRRPVTFLTPEQATGLSDGAFDLAINISSFDEMPAKTSAGYLTLFDRCCSFVYLNGFARTGRVGNTFGHDRRGLEEFAYPMSWQPLYAARHPVFPKFVEKLFRTGAGRSNLTA